MTRAITAGLLAVGLLAAPALALSMSDDAAITQGAISTATLAPATGVTADCTAVLGLGTVDLDWTATTSTFATGYRLYKRQNAGSWNLLTTLTPRTTVTYEDALGLLTGLLGATIDYKLVTYHGNWTSADSNTATVTVTLGGAC